jgi:phosphate transport system substrate-binding protein
MKKRCSFTRVLLGLASFALILGMAPSAWAGDAIVVIVNGANPVEDLSLGELRKLFLGDKSHWDKGRAVATVMVGPGAPERAAFLKIVCGMSDVDMGKYFMQAAFNGKSVAPPKDVASAAAVKSVVANSPGAIGFVKISDFRGNAFDGLIKSVKLDGAAAGDPGYKLKM